MSMTAVIAAGVEADVETDVVAAADADARGPAGRGVAGGAALCNPMNCRPSLWACEKAFINWSSNSRCPALSRACAEIAQ